MFNIFRDRRWGLKIKKVLGCFLDYLMVLCQLHGPYSIKWKNDMNDKMKRTWKEACMAYFKALSQHLLGGTSIRIGNLRQKNQTWDLPTMKQEC
jgi:hypothetical protein